MENRLSFSARGRNLSAHVKGYLAEKLALLWYIAHGYAPVFKPRRMPVQTDLLMKRGRTVVMVEVKYRATRSRGQWALHPEQKRRLHRQLTLLAGRYPGYGVRLDMFLVFPYWPFTQCIPALDLPATPTYHHRQSLKS